jgi:hypothetical protein
MRMPRRSGAGRTWGNSGVTTFDFGRRYAVSLTGETDLILQVFARMQRRSRAT